MQELTSKSLDDLISYILTKENDSVAADNDNTQTKLPTTSPNNSPSKSNDTTTDNNNNTNNMSNDDTLSTKKRRISDESDNEADIPVSDEPVR